jgi:hypothetical protein
LPLTSYVFGNLLNLIGPQFPKVGIKAPNFITVRFPCATFAVGLMFRVLCWQQMEAGKASCLLYVVPGKTLSCMGMPAKDLIFRKESFLFNYRMWSSYQRQSHPSPIFRILSQEVQPKEEIELRLGCSPKSTCFPFLIDTSVLPDRCIRTENHSQWRN